MSLRSSSVRLLFLAASSLALLAAPTDGLVPELKFGETVFVLKKADTDKGGAPYLVYEPASEPGPAKRILVSSMKGTTPGGMQWLDESICRPPLALRPVESVTAEGRSPKEDVATLSLIVNGEDRSSFVVILHRFTALPDGTVRKIELVCPLKYSGFSKGTKEFDKRRASWVASLLAMEPRLPAPGGAAAPASGAAQGPAPSAAANPSPAPAHP